MKRMREIRLRKGLTLEQLAELTGCCFATIRAIEIGKRPGSKHVDKIAEVLGVSKEKLMENIDLNKSENKCLNERCPLNKDKTCSNDVVLSGRAPCYVKDKIQPKGKKIKYNDTQSLFIR